MPTATCTAALHGLLTCTASASMRYGRFKLHGGQRMAQETEAFAADTLKWLDSRLAKAKAKGNFAIKLRAAEDRIARSTLHSVHVNVWLAAIAMALFLKGCS